MEWYEVLGRVIPAILWVIPLVLFLALAAFVLLAPIMFVASIGLHLLSVVRRVVPARAAPTEAVLHATVMHQAGDGTFARDGDGNGARKPARTRELVGDKVT